MLKRSLLIIAQGGLILLWFIFLRPHTLGGPASYIIVAGSSMEPTLVGGDFAVALRQNTYGAGDLVAFRVPAGEAGEGALVIHRIIGNEAKGFVTQGDNASAPDPWNPTADDILGRLWFSLPGGRSLLFLRQPLVLGALAGIWGAAFVLSGGKKTRHRGRKPGAVGGLRALTQLVETRRFTSESGAALRPSTLPTSTELPNASDRPTILRSGFQSLDRASSPLTPIMRARMRYGSGWDGGDTTELQGVRRPDYAADSQAFLWRAVVLSKTREPLRK